MTENNSKAKKQTASEKAAILASTKRGVAEQVTGVTLPPAPADRIRRVLWEGREYAIDPTAMDDVEVLEIFAEMEEKPFLLVKLIKILVGDEQWQRLKEEHKDESGRLTVTRLGEFMELANRELEALGN